MKRLKEIIHSVTTNFFLKKYIPQPSTMQLLKDIYPTVDWNRVDFYEGLPWFTPFIASYVNAQALPQFYSFSRFSIYLRKFDESRAQNLGDIIHEGMHVLQGMHFWKGYGFGIFRGFTIYYSALFMKFGYRNNPLEVPAYDQKFRFLEFCEKHNQHGILPEMDIEVLKKVYQENPLIFKKLQFKYEGNYFSLALGFTFSLLMAVIKPLIDLLVFLIIFLPSRFRRIS